MITMQEIADRAHVSIGTVSNVVNGKAKVRESLRARVLAVIQELGYQPSQLARALRRSTTNIVGMIIPDISNPFFPAVVRGAEDVASKASYHLVLCNTDNDPAKERSYLDELRSYHPSGLLIIPAAGSKLTAELQPESGAHTPTVCVDRCPIDWKGDAVLVANEEGSYRITKYLIQMGHRHLATITGPLHLTNAAARLKGFEKAIKESGLKVAPEFIQEGQFDRMSGYQCGLRLLKMLPRPTAIFAANDMIALGVLLASKELELRCPEDISLAGFDNQEFAEFTNPALTTVHQPGYQLGATAARILLDRIRGKKGAAEQVVLPTEPKIRNSVARVGGERSKPAPVTRPRSASGVARKRIRALS